MRKAIRVFLLILLIGVVVIVGVQLLMMFALPLAVGAIVLPIARLEDKQKKRLRKLGWGEQGNNTENKRKRN